MNRRWTAAAAISTALVAGAAVLALPAYGDTVVAGSTLEFAISSKENQQGLALANGRFYVAYDIGRGNGRLVEYDRSGKVLKRSGSLPLGHATEVGYRRADGNFYVLSSASSSPTRVAVVDMRPPKPVVLRQYNFSRLGSNGMVAIDNVNDSMLVSQGSRFTRLDMSGRVLSRFTSTRKLLLPQGIEVLPDGRILHLASGPRNAYNEINVFSATGTLQQTVRVNRAKESEGLAYDEAGRTLYAGMRWPNTVYRLDSAFLGKGTTPKPTPTPPAAPVAKNLLVNGNAEDGSRNNAFSPAVTVPGWRTSAGLTVLRYGFHPALPRGAQRSGKGYFAGGVSARSTATQRVSLPATARDIDAGRVRFTFAADLGGYRNQADNARVRLTWLSSTGAPLGTADLYRVTPAQRDKATVLLRRSAGGAVPAGARAATVVLTMTRAVGRNNDGYADNLSLVLHPAR